MIITNLAKAFSTKFCVNIAQVFAVQKRTALICTKLKMACAVCLGNNVFTKTLAKVSAYSFVIFKGVVVNVNFPADATAVLAFIGGTAEFVVIIRYIFFPTISPVA